MTEFAKDLTHEGRHGTLAVQEYVLAKQLHRMRRLEGHYDVIITDSPILMGLVYANEDDVHWKNHLIELHKRMDTLDIFLQRHPDKPYNPVGRNQTEEEAHDLDRLIWKMLNNLEPAYRTVTAIPEVATATKLARMVMQRLAT